MKSFITYLLLTAIFLSPLAIAQESPSPAEINEDQPLRKGGLQFAQKNFPSFLFSSKREVTVSQLGKTEHRLDQVRVKQDEKGNYWFKKTSSTYPRALEYFWIEEKAYRPEKDQSFSSLESNTLFPDLLKKTGQYYQDFWNQFEPELTFKKKGQINWQERPCEIWQVQSSPGSTQLNGEIWTDQKNGLVLKTNLEAKYRDENPGEDGPTVITIQLNEELKDIGKIAAITLPKKK